MRGWSLGDGAAIKAKVWTLDRAGFGAFVAKIPEPLGVGAIRLKDGGSVKGFLVEAATSARRCRGVAFQKAIGGSVLCSRPRTG
jgi:hypothetical protein